MLISIITVHRLTYRAIHIPYKSTKYAPLSLISHSRVNANRRSLSKQCFSHSILKTFCTKNGRRFASLYQIKINPHLASARLRFVKRGLKLLGPSEDGSPRRGYPLGDMNALSLCFFVYEIKCFGQSFYLLSLVALPSHTY